MSNPSKNDFLAIIVKTFSLIVISWDKLNSNQIELIGHVLNSILTDITSQEE